MRLCNIDYKSTIKKKQDNFFICLLGELTHYTFIPFQVRRATTRLFKLDRLHSKFLTSSVSQAKTTKACPVYLSKSDGLL